MDELVVADPAERWSAAGFRVEGDVCEVGTVRIRLAGAGERRGIVAWSVRDLASDDLDGLPTSASEPGLRPRARRTRTAPSRSTTSW